MTETYKAKYQELQQNDKDALKQENKMLRRQVAQRSAENGKLRASSEPAAEIHLETIAVLRAEVGKLKEDLKDARDHAGSLAHRLTTRDMTFEEKLFEKLREMDDKLRVCGMCTHKLTCVACGKGRR